MIHAALSRPSDCAARYGGEEFTCLLPNTAFDGALVVAENIRSCIAALGIAHRDGATDTGTVTASVGVATGYPSAANGWLDLLALADQQLYRAKGSGRNRVCGKLRGSADHRTGGLQGQ